MRSRSPFEPSMWLSSTKAPSVSTMWTIRATSRGKQVGLAQKKGSKKRRSGPPRAAWVALSVPSPTKAERMPPKDVTGMEKGSVRVEEWEAEKDESTTQSYVLAKRLSPERTQW